MIQVETPLVRVVGRTDAEHEFALLGVEDVKVHAPSGGELVRAWLSES